MCGPSPAKCDGVEVREGDVLYFNTWGGGGWGDPFARDTSAVLDTQRQALAAHASQKNWLDHSQGVDSYLHVLDHLASDGEIHPETHGGPLPTRNPPLIPHHEVLVLEDQGDGVHPEFHVLTGVAVPERALGRAEQPAHGLPLVGVHGGEDLGQSRDREIRRAHEDDAQGHERFGSEVRIIGEGVYHDDPGVTDEEKLRVSVCLTVPEGTAVGDEVKVEIEQMLDGIEVLSVVKGREKQSRDLLELYRSDPDPGVHGATEWVLRRWGR